LQTAPEAEQVVPYAGDREPPRVADQGAGDIVPLVNLAPPDAPPPVDQQDRNAYVDPGSEQPTVDQQDRDQYVDPGSQEPSLDQQYQNLYDDQGSYQGNEQPSDQQYAEEPAPEQYYADDQGGQGDYGDGEYA
jgi:hypothetical protein